MQTRKHLVKVENWQKAIDMKESMRKVKCAESSPAENPVSFSFPREIYDVLEKQSDPRAIGLIPDF
jgi:hypothetical protein